MKTPISYYGGQQRSLKHILPLIPEHNLYNEPFAGGAALLFAKNPANINVINDINGENPSLFSNVKRAWAVWVLSKMGFAGKLNGSYGYCKNDSDSMTRKVLNGRNHFYEEMKELLEKCNIENDHAFKVIRRYDTKNTFHFLAPPYINTNMGHYDGLFKEADLIELLDLMTTLEGKFMLMMFPDKRIRHYAKEHGWTIHKIERIISASKLKDKQRIQEEWMVCNYVVNSAD